MITLSSLCLISNLKCVYIYYDIPHSIAPTFR